MTYEDFCTPFEVEIFKRVKGVQMRLAHTARQVVAELVGASLPDKGKQLITTNRGLFRLAMGENSDNTTEMIAHSRMGAQTVVMSDEADMGRFFSLHGVTVAYDDFLSMVKGRL